MHFWLAPEDCPFLFRLQSYITESDNFEMTYGHYAIPNVNQSMNILSRVYMDNPVISSVLLTVFPVAELAVH